MNSKDLGIDLGLLTEEDKGMRVCYVPLHARDENTNWLNHKDCEWGRISSWNERFIHVQFPNLPNTQACDPGDLFPEHRSSYSKRLKNIVNMEQRRK